MPPRIHAVLAALLALPVLTSLGRVDNHHAKACSTRVYCRCVQSGPETTSCCEYCNYAGECPHDLVLQP